MIVVTIVFSDKTHAFIRLTKLTIYHCFFNDIFFKNHTVLFEREDVKVTSENRYKVKKLDKSYILYDDHYFSGSDFSHSVISDSSLPFFDGDHHANDKQRDSATLSHGTGIGRARVVYFIHNNVAMVLKHYYRGGAVAALIKDHYFGFSIENTRSFREWRLLKKMRSFDLPVPDAVAAHVKKGLFYYQADLVTRKLENTKTLSDVLNAESMSAEQWKKVGVCIKLFHQKNIYHADLNARNILLNQEGEVYLIDFDNSYIRSDSKTWKMSNLARLKRSLLKFKKNESVFHFEEQDWSALLTGYR